jgi:tetratricopeptide (TPR) repeat protein
VLALAAGIAVPAFAADEALVLRMRAEQLAADGRCEEAIDKARRAQVLDPADGKAAVIEGRCLLLLRRYDEAIAPLEKAREKDPTIGGIAADLASAHYHNDDRVAAERELAKAEAEQTDDPRAALYRGLLLLERNQDVEAAQAFERASRMDAAIDPLASYYAGLAWERAREREAEIALERLDGRRSSGKRRWWGAVTAGVEWDDNVVLRGDGTILPGDISDQRDWRGYWSAELGAELLRGENWAAGVIAGYHGNAHFEEHQFDLQYPTASLWLDRRIDDRSFVRLQPFTGYAWTETDPYVFNAGGTAAYHRNFGRSGSGRLYGQYIYRNYMFTAQGSAAQQRFRDRDGDEYRGGYDHSISVGGSTTARAGGHYSYHHAEGGEYSHDQYGGYVGVRQGLPLELTLDVEGSYAYQHYDRASSFLVPAASSPDRRDNVYRARAQLSRPITDWLSAAAHWRWTDNDSNTAVFDYDRHVLGGSVTVSFGPR